MNAAAKRPAKPGPPLSVEDAHRRLPLVRAITTDIVGLHRDVADRKDRLEQIRKLPGGKRHEDTVYAEELQQIERELVRDEGTLRGYVAELENIGGRLRDPEAGRVEFPGQLSGQDVYFGWQQGEENFSYWRPFGSKETERRSLLLDSLPPLDGTN